MIPKILHQLWIGPKISPTNLMDTWKQKNPDFEYIRWNEQEINKRKLKLVCQSKIASMEEINGKADIIRWEILYEYGGIFVDADSICIESIDNILLSKICFAGYEHEKLRPGLIATGTMGFPPKHPLVKAAIDWIKLNPVNQEMAWKTVGPGLLTRMYNSGKFKDLTIFPSYTFLPIHYTGNEYLGKGKIYAYQEWGSTKRSYDTMNNITLPSQFLKPSINNSVSVLISSYNTKTIYIQECLKSIKNQIGHFNIELVWINDGSDENNTILLKRCLEDFENTTRFIKVIYSENNGNQGIGFTLNKGINLCSNELIIKMDSDDIMIMNRIQLQLEYMKKNPEVTICGGQVRMFNDNKQILQISNHKSITWENYKKNPNHWFINHPTVCYRKTAVLKAGNYNPELKQMAEDFELELRMLKTHGYIHNLPDILLNYRIHENQITFNGGEGGRNKWNKIRNDIIYNIINN